MNFITKLEDRVHPQSSALLVLDMVKSTPDAPPSMEIPRVRAPLSRLIDLIDSGRKVGLRVIFVKNSYSDWVRQDNWNEAWARRPDYHPRRYSEDTRAVELHDGLVPQKGDAVLAKRYYSAFAHGPLDLMLQSQGIKSVMLTGGATLGAVETAAKDCYVRGYCLVLVKDCVIPDSGPDYEIVMRHGEEKLGAIVSSSDQIINAWNRSSAKGRVTL